MLVATHHKVLTVFLSRVFRVFAGVTARSYDLNSGKRLDYSSDVQIDHKSTPQWKRMPADLYGLHVIRDPRDIVVSSAFYHTKSAERWLHRPNEKYDGLTYQQKINSLKTVEERLVFEIEESSGVIIRDMLAWDYQRQGIVELRYDELVGEGAAQRFEEAITGWPITSSEKALLVSLFRYFSLGGPGTKKSSHIRNPKSGQWQQHFTPRVQAAFDAAFPDAVERLGYGNTTDEVAAQ